jgi:hypothetical protein
VGKWSEPTIIQKAKRETNRSYRDLILAHSELQSSGKLTASNASEVVGKRNPHTLMAGMSVCIPVQKALRSFLKNLKIDVQ